MVSVYHLNERVNECKKQFYTMIKHSYLQKFIQEPLIDEDRIKCIFSMLERIIPNEDLEVLALSMLLVEAALDTHEEVSLHQIKSDFIRKNRQLTVLAGDYYCSLYYYLLADSGQIPMIRVFSESIQDINESKMAIYKRHLLPFDKVAAEVRAIESLVLQKIANYYNIPMYGEAISEFFFLKRLVMEREQFINESSDSALIRALAHSLKDQTGQYQSVLSLCNQQISESRDRLSRIANHSNGINQMVEQLLKGLPNLSFYKEKVVEEG